MPKSTFIEISIVVDNFRTHKVKAVARWVATHPRVTLLLLSTYYPCGSPIERAFGDMHDCCTCNHRRKRPRNLVADVAEHLHVNGPWKYELSDLYDEPAVTVAVAQVVRENQLVTAI
jgi:hypothetical protein